MAISLQAVLSLKDNLTPGLNKAKSACSGFDSKMKSLVGSGAAMQVGMTAVNTAISAVTSNIGSAVSRFDTLNQFPKIMSQMGLASEDAANSIKKGLVKSIEGLPTTLDDVVASTKNFAVLTGDLDLAADTAVALNDAFLASGSSSADASRGMTQYSQMLAKGKVDQQAWNTLCETMGYGLGKTAKSMLGAEANQRDLYAALQDGTVTFDDFNREIIKLDKAEGGFADTARTASVGVATSINNVKTAIVSGLEGSITAIDTAMKNSGVKWLEGGIAGTLNNLKGVVSNSFKEINGAISKVNFKGYIDALAPAFEVLKMVASGTGTTLSKVLGILNDHPKTVTRVAGAILGLVAAYKLSNKLQSFTDVFRSQGQEAKRYSKSAKTAKQANIELKDSFGKFAKMAGVAAIVASLALLASSMAKLGALGATAVPPLATFGAVVAGLAGVFALTGKKLQASAIGIGVFSASISAMAATMAKVASTGTEGARAMAVFGVVVAGLAGVFSLLGGALTGGAVGILAFGASVALIGYGLKSATPAIDALGTAAIKAGSAVSVAANGIGDGFLKISDGAVKVVDAISGGLSTVLDSIAGVIESVGISARNAGAGFLLTARGINAIAQLSLWDIVKSLGAVATGLGEISTNGRNMPEIGLGMQQLAAGMAIGASGLTVFNAGLGTFTGLAASAAGSVVTLKTAFAGFVLPAPNTGAFVSTFNSVIRTANSTVSTLRSAGVRAGNGYANGLQVGMARARSAVSGAASSIASSLLSAGGRLSAAGRDSGNKFSTGLNTGLKRAQSYAKSTVTRIGFTLRSGHGAARSAGAYISQGFANGMLSCLGTIESAAARMVSAANKAIEAKAKIASPSKVSTRYGNFYGIGWVNGIKENFKKAKEAAAGMVSASNLRGSAMAFDGAGYTFGGGSGAVTVEVPVNLDGKEVARITAPYTEMELSKRQTRADRKRGVR